MKFPVEVDLPPDNYCPYCKAALIELYDVNNHPKYYRNLLNKFKDNKLQITDIFTKTELAYFKCYGCRRKFFIDWTFGYPIPYIPNKGDELNGN